MTEVRNAYLAALDAMKESELKAAEEAKAYLESDGAKAFIEKISYFRDASIPAGNFNIVNDGVLQTIAALVTCSDSILRGAESSAQATEAAPSPAV